MARKVGLAVGDVLYVAVQVADADGYEAVTLASVAARLRIRSPSLYAHVDGLPGLRRLLMLHAARLFAEALRAGSRSGAGWEEALAGIAAAYRDFARRRPGLYGAAHAAVERIGADDLQRAAFAMVAPAVEVFAAAGVPTSERVHLARLFRATLHGFVLLEQAGGFGSSDSIDESFRRMVALLTGAVGAAATGDAATRGVRTGVGALTASGAGS